MPNSFKINIIFKSPICEESCDFKSIFSPNEVQIEVSLKASKLIRIIFKSRPVFFHFAISGLTEPICSWWSLDT